MSTRSLRSLFLAVVPLAVALLAVTTACGGPPSGLADGAPIDARVDAPPIDAPPPDGQLPVRGPAVVLDDVHIAGLTEDPHAFSLLGQAVNPQLMMSIQSGQLLLGLELLSLDDPSGQVDPELQVGMYNLVDDDADATNNFDPDLPEYFHPGPGALNGSGVPNIFFTTAVITAGGMLHAEGADTIMGLGGIPLPLQQPEIDGTLVASDDQHIRVLQNGRLRGAVPAQLLAFAPNITGGMCMGTSLLDVLVGGCGFPISLQPDVDLDGDGLEKFYDTMAGTDADAGAGMDGSIDRCVDGDGTELLGTTCVQDPRFADGYRLILVIHGVRATILAQ